MNKKIQFLDCTLRDGGYYNNWSFSTSLINDYIYAVAKAKVNIIEIGFRFLENENFKGQCAYADDAFINSLDIPSNIDIAVMTWDAIESKITSIDRKSHRISLSIKALEAEAESEAVREYSAKSTGGMTSLGDKLKEQLSKK